MFFYGTIKSYAEPWIDKLSSTLTESARVENQAITQRLASVETMLSRDFSVADQSLQALDFRLQLLEATDRADTLETLRNSLERITEQQAAFVNDITRVQQRVINLESNDRRLPSAVAERDLHPLKLRLQILEETAKAATINSTDTDQLKARVDTLCDAISKQAATIQQLQTTINEQITGPMLRLIDRGSETDARISALEGNMTSDRLERENSKLKRKSFLSMPHKAK